MTADAIGGVLTYALDLASALRPHGIDVTLALVGPPMSEAQRVAALTDGLTLVETGLPLEWLAEDERQVKVAAAEIAALATSHGAQIVHLNTPALALSCYDIPVVATIHSCVASWWRAVRGGELPPDFAWRTRLTACGLERADVVTCPSESFADAVAVIYGRRPTVLRNGRAAADLSDDTRGPLAAFTAGRLWDEGKNIAVLDSAADLISFPVYAAGSLVSPTGIREELKRIIALGHLNQRQIRAHLGRRPIFVSAALYEPFGLTVLEAAQAGCALVLSDTPTFRELWGEAAVFFPPRDPKALAKALNQLAASSSTRDRLGAAARLNARRYSSEALALRMAEIYRRLRGLRRPAASGAAA